MSDKSIFLLIVIAIVSTASPTPAVVRYNVTDLGTLEGYPISRAWAINNNGQIVGNVADDSPDDSRAILFDASGGGNNIDLGTLGGENSWAGSINNNAQIVGAADSNDSQQSPQATIFDPNGEGNNTGLGEKGSACSINDNGQIVGYAGNVEDCYAVLFDPTGQGNNIDLGTLDGYLHSVAYSINNSGQSVGYAFNDLDLFAFDVRAVLFDPTGQGDDIDLGTLGGETSAAVSTNDNGQIVGRASIAPNPDHDSYWLEHATLFDPNGAANNIDLGTLDEFGGSVAASINNKGQIVGQAWEWQVWYDYGKNFRAVLFNPTGAGNNTDLNSLINPALNWTLWAATCINDNGLIVGFGINPNGDRRAFLLTPATPGDFEPDRDMDLKDFAVFAAAWQSSLGADNWNPFCDISDSNDGVIDELDLAVFANYYLTGTP